MRSVPMLYKVTGAGHSVCVWVRGGGGVRGSEFNGAWGKKRGGGGGDGRVELPYSLMYEAVLQSAGPRLETPQSPPWWQQTEEAVVSGWVGSPAMAEGFAGETDAVDVLEGGERDTTISQLLSLSVEGYCGRTRLQAPYHTVMQLVRMLSMVASVEGAHDGGRRLWLFWVCGGSRDAAVLSWPVLQCC